MTNNKPTQIQRPNPPQRPNPSNAGNQTKKQSPPLKKQDRPQNKQRSQNSDSRQVFHNPYNFVPATPRQNIEGELGDRSPRGHGQYLDNLWSGRIRVDLITVTPLLIPDAAQAEKWQNSEHATYPLRLVDGKPYLPPTSIKGSLRAAYEAVTNSRLGIFSGHDDKLAYRMDTKLGRQMVPARIESYGRGGYQVVLYPGKSTINNDGSPNGAVYAAWLPRYANNPLTYKDGTLPEHEQEVEAWVEEVQHYRWNKKYGKYEKSFVYWRAVAVAQISSSNASLLGAKPQPKRDPQPPQQKSGNSYHQRLGNVERIKGFVCVSGRNADNKHDERIFFRSTSPTQRSAKPIPLTSELQAQWTNLITDYQEIHKDELHEPKPSALNISGGEWSSHIRDHQKQMAKSRRTLTEGSLCYAHVEKKGNDYVVKGLYPVTLSRGLFDNAPSKLLQDLTELSPATDRNKLSPADRVFGWVNQKGKGAYKGQLRLHSVKCLSTDAIQEFTDDPATNPGLPLTILGQPKPQQSRFYVAKNKQGEALGIGSSKQDGYASENQGLRGRKVYPHHKAIAKNADYWNDPMSDRTGQSVNGCYQEYRRPKKDGTEQRDSQNRSIQAWVKQNTRFQFDIDITNLSPVELGALLWLLELPDDHYHRLGGGKPLGFGSVQLKIDWSQTDLRLGQAWKQYYESLLPIDPPDPRQATECVDAFKQAVALAYSPKKNTEDFEEVLFIKAFKQAAKGLDGPVHYPRMKPQPDPDGENYKWFTKNESGEKRSLPPLWDETGLPYWE